ncbi:MAG: hypothetical protein WCF40_04440 [Desulfobacterales bacterium]|jgi:hypothetical protein
MKTKLLFYTAVVFFILGFKTQDAALYFFFATHLLTLSLCVYFYSRENRSQLDDETTSIEDESD